MLLGTSGPSRGVCADVGVARVLLNLVALATVAAGVRRDWGGGAAVELLPVV